jgi:two-component system, cell cycle response regulator
VARIGGEEFLIAMRDTDAGAAAAAAERLRRIVSASAIRVSGLRKDLAATISIGVAVGSPAEPSDDVPDLIDRADRALLAAKAEGRNQVSLDRPAA